MAWNGRVVKTYGRQKKRMIKNEPAWISPEIKTGTGGVFSPDTDVSATSTNTSLDGSIGDQQQNGRRNKHRERKHPLITALGKVEESEDKENIVSLAPETPEEVQGPRRRGLRNARKITIKRIEDEEGTPKLFSSDSEDGLRKMPSRKVLQRTNANLREPVTRKGRVPSADNPTTSKKTNKPSKKSRRVKNVIQNDVFSVVRSPPARGHRSSKRYRFDNNKRSESSPSFNASMSPFAIMESWIDSIKDIQTSTPMVALVKLDIVEENILDVVKCANGGEKGIKHRQSGSCKCAKCQETQDVASKLFELTLSDAEDSPRNGCATRGTSRTLNIDKCRKSKKSSSADSTSDSEVSNGEIKHSLRNRQRNVKQKDTASTTDEDNISSEAESRTERRDLRRGGLRNKQKKMNYSTNSDEDGLTSGKVRNTSHGRMTSRGNRASSTGEGQVNSSTENCSVHLNNLSSSDVEANLRGPSVMMKGLSPADVSSHLCSSSVVLRGISPKDMEAALKLVEESSSSRDSSELQSGCSSNSRKESVSLHPLSKKMQDMHLSCDADAEDAGEQDANDEEEVEEASSAPICPRTPCTPRNKRLASFHTDSFKEVFTPKKNTTTGLAITGRDKVLLQCEQSEPISFTEGLSPAMLRKCTKIGEGVYGEVFRTSIRRESVALKIIPIEGDFEVNEEPQKTFEEILPEIVISRELSYLKDSEFNYTENYIHVNKVSCCVGKYPKVLLTEWDRYDERKGSENDRPDMFDEDQLYIIFEFEDGGQDLEGFEFTNLNQAISVLQQVAGALAVAELELSFEHRDLHWGNVLIRPTTREHVGFRLGDETYSLESHGLEVSIIDFTLSRLMKDDCTVFCDLSADPTLFEGTGDYQFDMYRKMKEENSNNWEPFRPYTNVLWMHYLTDKLLKAKTYKNRGDRKLMMDLRTFFRNLLGHESAEEVVRESDLFTL